ncbi:hypothetical protein PUN28_018511 [Cardiocondyla obscurior]|uniref:Uncharacterized protein n=1 Tax=Cardiocondyla obscurior TaxID=286306 RepID=A0AAW2EE61_9HYME
MPHGCWGLQHATAVLLLLLHLLLAILSGPFHSPRGRRSRREAKRAHPPLSLSHNFTSQPPSITALDPRDR